jgi:oligosaccharyltransferase complex subunit alpha (ribophorin I)
MISVRLLLQVLFAFICACAVSAFPNQFENTKIIRTIDVNSAIAREDVGIRAKNVDKAPASEYFFYVPIVIAKSTASISAFMRKQKTELDITLEDVDAAK